MSLRSQRTAVTLAVTCLVLSSLAWAGEVKPPVNAGEAWRVYDASGKEVSRLVLGGIDVKTGQLSYTTVDLATGTAAPAAHALPWEVRDVIKTEVAKGDHADRGVFLDRAQMNFQTLETVKAADLGGAPAAQAGAPGGKPGAPAAGGKPAGPGAEGAAAPPGAPAAGGKGGPGGPAAPAAEGPGAGAPPGGPSAGGKGGPGAPGGEAAVGAEGGAASEEGGEGGGKGLPLPLLGGAVAAVVLIVVIVLALKKKKAA
jgi:hypothetical protein